eukprot:scaffold19983_cov146-Isochrysis_galbana.AAC.2
MSFSSRYCAWEGHGAGGQQKARVRAVFGCVPAQSRRLEAVWARALPPRRPGRDHCPSERGAGVSGKRSLHMKKTNLGTLCYGCSASGSLAD